MWSEILNYAWTHPLGTELSVLCPLTHPTVPQSPRIQIIELHHALHSRDEAQKSQENMYYVETSCPEISALAKCTPEWHIFGASVTTAGEASFFFQSKVSSAVI